MRLIIIASFCLLGIAYCEDIAVKQFELKDGRKIDALRYMMITEGAKTLYQVKLLNGKSISVKGEDVKEITDSTVSDSSLDTKTAERLKNESDQSARVQSQRAMVSETDKALADQYVDVMREYLAVQTKLKEKRETYNGKLNAFNLAKAQIPISEAGIISAEANYRAALLFYQTSTNRIDLQEGQARMDAARAESGKHTRLLAQAKEATVQLEALLPALASEVQALEVLSKEHQTALQEIKESRKSTGVVNPLK